MGTVNVTLGDATRLNLPLGQQMENEVTEVVFDFSAWKTAYGSGTISLSVQRPGDSQPYAVEVDVDGTDATWTVSSLDTAYNGTGVIQVTYTVGTVVKKSVVYMFTVYDSIGANGEYPSPGQTWQEEIEEDIADIKADLAQVSGLSADVKEALLACFEKVAWIDEDGQDYYDALESALYPPVDLVSISCVYTQSGTVYDTDSLDSLKTDLVVTAHYDNSTTATVTTYTLSGTLTEGTSTITVSYGGKTTTFSVTVIHSDVPSGYTQYDYLKPTATLGDDIKNYGIWTDLQLSTDYSVEMKLYVESGNTDMTKPCVMGTRSSGGGTKYIGLFWCNDLYDQVGYWFNGTDSSTRIYLPPKDQVNTFTFLPVGKSTSYPTKAVLKINSTEYDTGSTSTGVSFNQWFGIFNYATSSTGGLNGNETKYVGQRIGEIKVTDSNDDIVYHLIPAKDANDKYGYYEKVNGTFYYNATYATTGYTGGMWE